MKGQVTIYTLTGCPHCLQAKQTFREQGLPFTEVSVDRYSNEVQEWLKEKTGKSNVPQIFFNAVHIGGNDTLQATIKDEVQWADLLNILEEEFVPDSVLLPDKLEEKESGTQFHCNPDPQAGIVDELVKSGVPQSIRPTWLSRKYDNAFSGLNFVQWYCEYKEAAVEEGIREGGELLKKKFILPLDNSVSLENIENDPKIFYRLNESCEDVALNAGVTQNCEIKNPNELAETLRTQVLQLYSDYISSDGKSVDYEEMKNSGPFTNYVRLSRELQRVPVEAMMENERKAFFINIYNAMVIHATALYGPPKGWISRLRFFGCTKYIVGGHPYSLNDVENGVLRANKKGVLSLFSPFGKSDPRKVASLSKVDPRIHFALNCGAKSCPPIKIFSSQNIDEELDTATDAFFENDDAVQIVPGVAGVATTIRLSSLLKWYASDFGESSHQVLKWVTEHINDEKRSQLQDILDNGSWKISYIPYDWGTNAKE